MQSTEVDYLVRPLAREELGPLGALLDSSAVVVGAFADDTLVAHAAGSVRVAYGLGHPTGWIESFVVALPWRGHGVGRALLTGLLAELKRLGAERVHTVTARHDRAMLPFFREVGFREEMLVCLGRSL